MDNATAEYVQLNKMMGTKDSIHERAAIYSLNHEVDVQFEFNGVQHRLTYTKLRDAIYGVQS